MYQGGCGEVSKGRRKEINKRKNVCKICDMSEVVGQRSKEGFCVFSDIFDENNPECAAYRMFGGNVTVPRSMTLENEVQG